MPKIKISDVRLSFPDLFKATQYQGEGTFNYRASFLVTPGSQADKIIRGAIKAAADEKWLKKAAGVTTGLEGNPNKYCYANGDTKDYDGYAGNWVLSANRNQDKGRPVLIDRDKTPLTAEDGRPYAGCYVNASVEIWAQDNGFGKGIRCTLLGVQFVKDGDAFGGGAAPSADDFEEIDAPEHDEFADDLV